MQQQILRLIDVARVTLECHPTCVYALVNDDYLGHVPGYRETTGFPGSGDLAGDVVFRRRNADTPNRYVEWVTVITDPLNAHRGHIKALESATREDPAVTLVVEASESVRALLGQWNSLTPGDRQKLADLQQSTAERLRGARDRRKRLAYIRLSDAIGSLDALGRANPTATSARHQAAERLLLERYSTLDRNQRGIVKRLAWAEGIMAQLASSTKQLYGFLAEREVLTAADVADFYGLAEGLYLKPVNLTVGYICHEITRGGGRIDDPDVLKVIREGFQFERLMGWARETVRPLAHLSEVQAHKQRERLLDESLPELELLENLLGRLRVGGQYDRLIRRLHRRVQNMRLALGSQNWWMLIKNAKAFQYTLVYRSWQGNPAPAEWFSLPPGREISEGMRRYYLAQQTRTSS